MKNKTFCKRFFEMVWDIAQADDVKIKLASSDGIEYTIRTKSDIAGAVDTLLAVDDTIGVYTTNKSVWFLVDIFADNTDEVIIDYTDNNICNTIYNKLNNK
jgi:hypothetical protein